VDGPLGADENLFGWQSGVDKYHRDPQPPDPALGPSLHLTYVAGSRSASPTSPSASPTGTASVTPLPTPTTPPASATPDASPTPDGGTTPSTAPTPEPTEWPTPSATSEATLEPTATRPPPTATDAPRVPTATGPAEQRQVCLSAFDDLDGDGARGPSERFLAGVTVKLTHLASGAFVTWTTDGQNDPDYCWSGLTDGHYVMAAVEAPLGYAASGPTTYQLEVPFPGQPAVYAFAWRRPDVPTPTGEGGETPVLDTPAATASPTPSATATATLTPTPSATPTTEPTVGGPSGEICVGVYGDGDRSGDRGPGEVFLGQVPVTVRDANRRQVRSLVTVNLDLVCARLATGVYFVSVNPGPGRYVTSGQEMAVLLTDRQRRILEFGLGQAAAENTIHCPFVVR
jgi:hypothetical protein